MLRPVSDLIDKLAGPVAAEIGMTFGDAAARVYRFKRALKLLHKVQRLASECGYDPAAVRPKILLPILEHASVEDDDVLHDRWAALLANACNPDSDITVSPSFPEILAELSSKEAILLDAIQRHVESNLGAHYSTFPKQSNWAYLVDVGTWKTIVQLYAQLGLSRVPTDVLLNYPQLLNAGSTDATADYSDFRVTIDNLFRLGLLREVPVQGQKTPVIHITALGYEFVRACRNPVPQNRE